MKRRTFVQTAGGSALGLRNGRHLDFNGAVSEWVA